MKSFWRNPLYWLIGRGQPEADSSAGWGPFRLPARCEWMERAAAQHDFEYKNSAVGSVRRSESDARLFENWVRAADAEFDPIKKCARFQDICRFWPLARKFGLYFWDEREKRNSNDSKNT